MTEKRVVMQPRCIFCKREQYAPAVSAISRGKHPCVWCGKTPPVFNNGRLYFTALEKENYGKTDVD